MIKTSNNYFNCLPSFPMEVHLSQHGSVESLRKVNDILGINSIDGNLNQHCSICARVKTEPCVNPWPSNPICAHASSFPNWLFCATFTSNLNSSLHPSHNQTPLCLCNPASLTFCLFIRSVRLLSLFPTCFQGLLYTQCFSLLFLACKQNYFFRIFSSNFVVSNF